MKVAPVIFACALFWAEGAFATGHGPVYGLATPTLAEGAWSIDVGAMGRLRGPPNDATALTAMIRPMLGYGITELFRKELPHADWRVFVEAVGELTGRDRIAGTAVADSGGNHILVGPTVLGLFGSWGISGGPMFVAYSNLNGTQREDRLRLVTNFTYWF